MDILTQNDLHGYTRSCIFFDSDEELARFVENAARGAVPPEEIDPDFDPYTAFFEDHIAHLRDLAAVLDSCVGFDDDAPMLRDLAIRLERWLAEPVDTPAPPAGARTREEGGL